VSFDLLLLGGSPSEGDPAPPTVYGPPATIDAWWTVDGGGGFNPTYYALDITTWVDAWEADFGSDPTITIQAWELNDSNPDETQGFIDLDYDPTGRTILIAAEGNVESEVWVAASSDAFGSTGYYDTAYSQSTHYFLDPAAPFDERHNL
jgi:hypothetical protein